jgi:23S rRNA (pseudouridine1915-N3)-methyltransferase
LITDYLSRIIHMVSCEIIEIPDVSRRRKLQGDQVRSAEAAEIARRLQKTSRLVVLDERGKQFTSPGFAQWLETEMSRGTKDISFVIGGPEGIESGIIDRADLKLSLGTMTWTHEMSRVLLIEQIYRAFSILRGLPYHK